MSKAEFAVVDAMRAPHGGWILHLRLESGKAPTIRQLRRADLLARGPSGEERRVQLKGFPLFGGTPSDKRLADSGRIQVHVEDPDEDASALLATAWKIITD